jgi:hypothetical protein
MARIGLSGSQFRPAESRRAGRVAVRNGWKADIRSSACCAIRGFHKLATRITLPVVKKLIRGLGGTVGQRAGAIDGLNLFFGALLGANLGTLDGLRLVDYIKLISLLAATVMALRMVSTSEKRSYMLLLLAVYVFLLAGLVSIPAMKPQGMDIADLNRLVATLAIWVAFAMGIELAPRRIRRSDQTE